MGFNLDSYETVEERLVKFWEAHPEGRILTNIHHYDDNKVVIKAEIYFNREDDRPVATGYAEEVRGSSPVNKTAHVENADTSAIGRGLANCGFQSKSAPRPSRQEMQKVERYNAAPAPNPVSNGLVSADNIERFKKACADAGLQVDQVAQNAGVDLNGLRESDMPALRASFKDLKEFASAPETGFGSTDEAVAAVIDLFAGEEVQPSIDNHPAGGGKPQIKDPGGVPSPKQLGLIRSLGRGKELGNDDLIQAVSAFIGRDIAKLDDLTKGEASTAIEALQK